MKSLSTHIGPMLDRPHGPAVQLRKPAIALVLAGGRPHPDFGPGAPPFRPLLPVLGRPIVAHVLSALEASCVRKILVFHDPACDIASAVDAGPKVAFLPLPATTTPIGESVRHALEASVRACGIDAVRRSRLLILPCDQPFTTPAVIDRVLRRADALEFDFAYTAVSRGLLSQRYPGKPFRFYPAADLGGPYALQTATLVDGTFIFGFDSDTQDVFRDTVEMILQMGLDTYTLYMMTPYPGTPPYEALRQEGRLTTDDFGRYDWDHAVVRPRGMTAQQLDEGVRWAYNALDHEYRKRYLATVLRSSRFLLKSPVLAAFLLSSGWPRRYTNAY